MTFESDAAQALDQATARAAGAYLRLNAGAQFSLPLGTRSALDASLRLQWSSKNLDGSEKMALGGPDGVRAYPVGDAAGDDGWLLRLALRRDLALHWIPGRLEATAGVEAGRVVVNKTPWPGAGAPNERALYGGTVGARWSRDALSAAVYYAMPIVGDPAPETRGQLWWEVTWRL